MVGSRSGFFKGRIQSIQFILFFFLPSLTVLLLFCLLVKFTVWPSCLHFGHLVTLLLPCFVFDVLLHLNLLFTFLPYLLHFCLLVAFFAFVLHFYQLFTMFFALLVTFWPSSYILTFVFQFWLLDTILNLLPWWVAECLWVTGLFCPTFPP